MLMTFIRLIGVENYTFLVKCKINDKRRKKNMLHEMNNSVPIVSVP